MGVLSSLRARRAGAADERGADATRGPPLDINPSVSLHSTKK
jgi:hypothetical protein